MTDVQVQEITKCAEGASDFSTADGCIYWINNFVRIEDPQCGEWLPFKLYPEQADVVRKVFDNQKTIALKARQLGLSWLMIAIELWIMQYRPGSAVTLFSRRDDEAIFLLDDRMKGMHAHLPEWLQSKQGRSDSKHEWRLANGSVARAFPTSAGDAYTTTIAVVDEADLVPDLAKLLKAVEPTIGDAGRLVLISKSDKSRPTSHFKKIFRAARNMLNGWCAVFLSWRVRPDRTEQWYEEQKRASLENTQSLDDLHENYPATVEEALAATSSDKRLPVESLDNCYESGRAVAWEIVQKAVDELNEHLDDDEKISLPTAGLAIYNLPQEGRRYAIGGDPAEGNPTSDDSAAQGVDAASYEQVFRLSGKIEPAMFGVYLNALSRFYNRAGVMVERNNHGHAVLLWLKEHTYCECMEGADNRPGWVSSTKGKAIMYSSTAEALQNKETVIHDLDTYLQLASIVGGTLRAPEGENDDLADAFTLAIIAAQRAPTGIMF